MKKAIITFPKQHHPNKACWNIPYIPVEFIQAENYVENIINRGFGAPTSQWITPGALIKFPNGKMEVVKLETLTMVDEFPTEEMLISYDTKIKS